MPWLIYDGYVRSDGSARAGGVITHWGWVTHICISKITIIGSDNGLSPGPRQAVIWTNTRILLIRTLRTYFNITCSFKKMHLKLSSEKWQQHYFFLFPFCKTARSTESCIYLTGVTTAILWRHQSNLNVITKRSFQWVWKWRKSTNERNLFRTSTLMSNASLERNKTFCVNLWNRCIECMSVVEIYLGISLSELFLHVQV